MAPYRYEQKPEELLAEIRDAQLLTLKNVEHTRMVVTTDVGDPLTITPSNKQVIGQRLAFAALADVYKELLPPETKKVPYSGPIFEAISINENQARLTFKHATGLKIRDGDSKLTCFLICGKDKVFHPASAKIAGEHVDVSAPMVDVPIAVRFGWNDLAQPNLFNGQGLPASPFRTDDFPLISEGRDF